MATVDASPPDLPPGWRPIDAADLPALARLEQAADVADGERFPTTLDDLTLDAADAGQDLWQMSMAIEGPTGSLIGWCWLEPRLGGTMWNRIHVHGSVDPGARRHAVMAGRSCAGRKAVRVSFSPRPTALVATSRMS